MTITTEEKQPSAIALLRHMRNSYNKEENFHKSNFQAFLLILLLDFIVIIYVRAIHLDAIAWAGIIFLLVLIAVEARQHQRYKELKEDIDNFYLEGEYETKRQNQ